MKPPKDLGEIENSTLKVHTAERRKLSSVRENKKTKIEEKERVSKQQRKGKGFKVLPIYYAFGPLDGEVRESERETLF